MLIGYVLNYVIRRVFSKMVLWFFLDNLICVCYLDVLFFTIIFNLITDLGKEIFEAFCSF